MVLVTCYYIMWVDILYYSGSVSFNLFLCCLRMQTSIFARQMPTDVFSENKASVFLISDQLILPPAVFFYFLLVWRLTADKRRQITLGWKLLAGSVSHMTLEYIVSSVPLAVWKKRLLSLLPWVNVKMQVAFNKSLTFFSSFCLWNTTSVYCTSSSSLWTTAWSHVSRHLCKQNTFSIIHIKHKIWI